ncbi:MAG: ATP-binding protein, partial [Candidatus Sericytochromatia bacterium]
FKELIISINKVSSGDFSTKLEYNEKSDFYFLAKTFNDMTVKIQEALKSKDRLVADVSHELRSPLTKIRLSLEILGKNEKVNHKYIDKAINEIELLDKLIDDIIDSSKLDLDKNINFEKVNVSNLLKESISKNSLMFEEKQIQTELKSFEKEVFLNINKQMMERVFDNLNSNLIKYAPEKTKADFIIDKVENNVSIKIRDRGKGVNDYEYEKIFEPFYRADESRTRKTGGTGLGLSIVKKIIELHNGKIKAYKPDDSDGGLTIEIILPIS